LLQSRCEVICGFTTTFTVNCNGQQAYWSTEDGVLSCDDCFNNNE
jgi:hypothetical protein